MDASDLIQGSEQWRLARCGSLGASKVADALAKIKTGWGASRSNVMADLVVERLTGAPLEGFTSDAMRWGTEQEPSARAEYELRHRCEVQEIGLVRHASIVGTHASPDGLIGEDGLLEIKCPQASAHLETLQTCIVPNKYETQIQWQLACTGRTWCDYVSFHPKMPEPMVLFVKRVHRDDVRIAELERGVADFLKEVDQKVADLRARYIERRDPLIAELKQSAALAGAA